MQINAHWFKRRSVARGFRCIVLLFAIGSTVQAAFAEGTVIDDFTEGPLAETLDAGTPGLDVLQEGLDPGGVIGGRRSVNVFLNFPASGEADVVVDTTAETFSVATTGELENYRLSWGLFHLTQGPASHALNADFSALDFIRIEVLAASQPHTAGIQFRSGVNEDSIESTVKFVLIPATATPLFIDVPIPQLPDLDPSDVDYIAIGEGPLGAGFALTLGGIVAIPEPGSLWLAGIGGLLLAATGALRRRTRQRNRAQCGTDREIDRDHLSPFDNSLRRR